MNTIENLNIPLPPPGDGAGPLPAGTMSELASAAANAAAVAASAVKAASASAAATELYGSFFLGPDEFALPAVCIREVVNLPAKISALPLSPAYLEGMFTLRGTVIPIVNLARLFNPGAGPAVAGNKVAIIEHQDVLVGMLFDDTGEILRVRPEQRSVLQYAPGATPGVIAGAILLDQGNRLLQVLDANQLVRIENVPQVLSLRASGQQRLQRAQAQGERRRCVSFRSAGTSFAFEMAAIQEIVRVPELQPSVLAGKLCLGRMNFRGNPVAVVDFAALLSAGASTRSSDAADPDQRIVVTRIGDATIAFLVDSVDSIIHFYNDDVLPIPLLSKARAGMFGGCLSRPDARPEQHDVILLDHAGIFSHSEIAEMRQGHANLYPLDGQHGAAHGKGSCHGARKVYLTFRIEQAFAVEITQVREIIKFSDNITRPPGTPDYMRGVLNLRQLMVSVIDLRSLYGMPNMEPTEQSRILIVERGQERYGLLVDGVEDIITVTDSQRFAAPRLMRSATAGASLQGDTAEVINIEKDDGSRLSFSVFDCGSLIDKLARLLP
ncbi:chemotaxis protein CheW [Massilia sp. Root351]|uniref:chemotaxis protein CheW n=1 Tax=Massilia sp. Root351 TaxID=1736522 RepID=UPI000B2F8F5C|nr:chemotaxis protein CheW [Massilia sp. Root351]